MADRIDRNPLITPEPDEVQKRCCPTCKSEDITGTNVQGVIIWKCLGKDCNTTWKTGIGRVPIPAREPYPYDPYKPSIDFVQNSKGEIVEVRRRVDLTPDFRKGAFVPEEGEE